MRAHDELIRFASVALSFATHDGARKFVFRRLQLSLPMNRRLAVLGARKSGKTTLLQLMAGTLAPDAGGIGRDGAVSPLANAGTLFHPGLTISDGFQFVARAYGLDPQTLTAAALALTQRRVELAGLVKACDPSTRRMLETATIAALPFSCRLVDDIGQLPQDFVERLMTLTAARGCGLIFSAGHARLARQHADAVVVISGANLYPFASVDEGVEFFEQSAR